MSEKIFMCDFGTTFLKVQAFVDDKYTETGMYPNRIYEIKQEYADGIKRQFPDMDLDVGIFTKTFVKEKGLKGHVSEIPPQVGAMANDGSKLETAYRNAFEQADEILGINISQNPAEWNVMTAIALPETEEVQKQLGKLHADVLHSMNVAGVHVRNQVFYAILGNTHVLKDKMKSPFTCHVVDIGGGDQKTLSVSQAPMFKTIRRESFGGLEVIEHARKIVSELLSFPVDNTEPIQKWLIENGSTDGTAPDLTVEYEGHSINIKSLLDSPRMLFEPDQFARTAKKRSLTEIVVDSLKAARMQGDPSLLDDLLGCILVTGGGSLWNGILPRLKKELQEAFPDRADRVSLILSDEPQFSTLNGMRNNHAKKMKKGEAIDWE